MGWLERLYQIFCVNICNSFRFAMNAHKPFFFVGTHFKTHLGFQRDDSSFGSGSSNRGESALLAEDSKGDSGLACRLGRCFKVSATL